MLFRALRLHLVVAPNTDVGKSLVTSLLLQCSALQPRKTAYLKPITTFSDDGSDDNSFVNKWAPSAKGYNLFQFNEPVSPHLAVQRAKGKGKEDEVPTDAQFVERMRSAIAEYQRGLPDGEKAVMFVETAGGVHSPSLTGTSQLPLYRPLSIPAILIASPALGGISTTLSALDSLTLHGYSTSGIISFAGEPVYENHSYFASQLPRRKGGLDGPLKVWDLPRPPPVKMLDAAEDEQVLQRWFEEATPAGMQIVADLEEQHEKELEKLAAMPAETRTNVWYPFVQHSTIKEDKQVMVIRSAAGDFFETVDHAAAPTQSVTQRTFDGSASWWTQCLGHSHPSLSLAAAAAAGRYGHVLFPLATNEPALKLARTMLDGPGSGWADRVFYSDDGSTGCEVGLKMALRAFGERYAAGAGAGATDEGGGLRKKKELKVLGLKGSYHGDTIGAMSACEGGVYSARVEWYQPRGFWLDVPQVRVEGGKVVISTDGGEQWTEQGQGVLETYEQIGEVYDLARRKGGMLEQKYRHHLKRVLAANKPTEESGELWAALVLEPVVMGAGGMVFIDPLFQHVLIDLVRTDGELFPDPLASKSEGGWTGLPVIFDEVFVGLRRLGPVSTTSLLHAVPDIAVYAKILTGGLVPLALTLARNEIFEAFHRPGKVDALLHGHSYTAHPVGCHVANTALEVMQEMDDTGAWRSSKDDWAVGAPAREADTEQTWSLWERDFVFRLSELTERIDGVMALGTVLVVHLRAGSGGGGYESGLAEPVLQRLREGRYGKDGWNVHARPLGNVMYFMTSLNSDKETVRGVQDAILEALSEEQ